MKRTEDDKPAGLLRKLALLVAMACLGFAITAGPAAAEFDVVPNGFSFDSLDASAQPDPRAAARPHQVTTVIETTTATGSLGLPIPDGNPKSLVVDLPVGFVGNPNSLPKCRMSELLDPANPGFPSCAPSTQVGILSLTFPIGFTYNYGVYNMDPAPGVPAQLGFNIANIPTVVDASVRPDDHGLRMTIRAMSQGISFSRTELTLWGVPASPAHDAARGLPTGGPPIPSGAPLRAFLTNPSDCTHAPVTKLKINAWQDTAWKHATYTGEPIEGCENVDFQPDIKVDPTNPTADTPSGYRIEVTSEQNDSPTTRATANLKKAVVTLPEGTAVNPSSADGLDACSEAEIGLGTDSEITCPDASKIGQVTIDSPIQSELMRGPVYLAKQKANPFGSTLALYMAPKGGGVQLKLPGEVAPDPSTGQLTTTFDENPQLPFTSLVMELNGGPRAALVNPPTCGTKTASAEFSSWSAPDRIEQRTSSFEITKAPNGKPCAENLADRGFGPKLAAGLLNPTASSYSPFALRLTRPDGDQHLSSLSLRMPEGVTAKLAGVDYCPDQALAAIDGAEGSGAAEVQSPSCPASSQVGTATVGVGGSAQPFYAETGKAYLAGPYKGAPLSMAVVVPALAGPLDLGSVVVRNALHVNPRTAQIDVASDPLPQIISGIPLRITDLRINIDRPEFMLSPSDCSPKQIQATIAGSHGATANLTNRFQVGGCASLGFNPKLRLDFGKKRKNTKRNAHPELNAHLSFNEGDSNISSVEVALPKGVLLDQARLGRICSRANYAAETCPEESKVGYAKATTPLLDAPVEGPVYLKASDNPLPDLAADLNGQIDIDLFGRIDQKENKKGLNQIRNTFDVVPDVPVSDFNLTLDGGNDGLLVNSQNICKSRQAQKVRIDIEAHNEMTLSKRPLIGSACKKVNKKKAKKLKKKSKKLKKKAKRTKKKARKAASGKKANKLQRKAKKLNKKSKKLKKQARKLGR